ncbi:MAG: ABC transporter permease, partial [Burkholderiales bacterium]
MQAFRSLLRSPRYAFLAIGLIAAGLGACTTVFSLFDSLLLRDRPGVVNAATLIDVGRSQNGSSMDNMAYADFADLRESARTVSGLAALRFDTAAAGLVIDQEAEPARAQWVSANFLHVLGTRLAAGRDFTDNGKPAAEIILS